MRIVAGLYGGRRLLVPKGRDVRPTSDKVRGAMFNTLSGYLDFDGVHVLDAFCGTGALGLEAISRGAGDVVFIDKARESLALARENVEALGVSGQAVFKSGDALTAHLNPPSTFDLVFLDPPYRQGMIEKTLQNLALQDVLADGAICVLESEKAHDPVLPSGFVLLKDKAYGDTRVSYVCYK